MYKFMLNNPFKYFVSLETMCTRDAHCHSFYFYIIMYIILLFFFFFFFFFFFLTNIIFGIKFNYIYKGKN